MLANMMVEIGGIMASFLCDLQWAMRQLHRVFYYFISQSVWVVVRPFWLKKLHCVEWWQPIVFLVARRRYFPLSESDERI
ncbi:MAG: hypothetical protein ABIR84_10695 [Candidatus Nitrotoga sp.]